MKLIMFITEILETNNEKEKKLGKNTFIKGN